MIIRNANLNDLETIYNIEIACFPPNQAATSKTLSERLNAYPLHFWVLEENGKIRGFINGMITNFDTVKDEMFKNVDLHDSNGSWQSVFGLAVAPEFQKLGYGSILIHHLIQVSKQNKLKGVTLTCEKHLIPYYEKLGFINSGRSASNHGGDVFYDMKYLISNN
ncbi:MAG: GNAT family N-acetyltransferase [Bacteroidetes bacterium]|nr:GNAT family N-acetyltransferase [Bacteroidota bacterium]MBK8342730.1 GNAT family N-acetyltransferase [Bacteroidota bacterium]